MSRRVVRYEGEGRQRRPVYADEGPSSAAAHDPIAMHERLSIPGMGPSGGAGPVERRQITEAERAIRQEARPSPIAPRRSAIVQEEPAVSEAAPIIPETIPVADDALSDLAGAVVEAIEARDAKAIADTAWQIAQRGLAAAWRAMPPLDLPDDAARLREPEGVDPAPPPVVESPPDHADSIPEPREAEVRHERLLLDPLAAAPVRPSSEGGRATAEQLQASRRNGQAAMQAQRRAVELTSAAAKATTRKGTTGQTRTPEQRERMRLGQLASIERRKAAAAS